MHKLLLATGLILLSSQALASDLAVEARWRPGTLQLSLLPPAGEHIAPEVPASGWVILDDGRIELQTDGAFLARGLSLSLNSDGNHEIEGELTLAVCADDGSTCRPASVAFTGSLSRRRGSQILDLVTKESKEEEVSLGAEDPSAAFERARAAGKLVLLDFSTQWCPPCQLLAAEVIHDPKDAELLAAFEVVLLDADSPASFPWKDRYKIGGYPTVVVVDPDGEVITRMLGYDGEPAFLAWLEEAAEAQTTVTALLGSLDTVPEAERARVARRLLDEGLTEEARKVIAKIPDAGERALLEFQIAPTLDLLDILATEQKDQVMEWIWKVVYELFQEDDVPEESRALVRQAVLDGLQRVAPEQAAELAYVLGDLTPEEQNPEQIFALGAAIYRASFEGNPQLDRGRYTFLATLLTRANNPEAAIAAMDEAIAAFPSEFTYHFERATLLKDTERLEEALASSQQAAKHAYGDTALRAGHQVAAILVELDRKEEAKDVLKTTLAAAERPEEGQEVRTWRYLEFLEKALEELDP